MNLLKTDAPAGWRESIVRSLMVVVVAFIVLQAKEWFDAGRFDTEGTATDAGLIGGGIFILNAILRTMKP